MASSLNTKRLDGKTAIVTGANTGIGKETAIDLAKRGARVIIACRSQDRGKPALKEIQDQSNSQQVYLEKLDLASLASVREFVEKITQNEPRLDILINNAGVMMCPYTKTEDGFEMQIGVNHLGHFLLTNLLLDLLKKSAPSRIVNVSSLAHRRPTKFKFEFVWNENTYNKFEAYCQSKLANVLFTKELARRLEGTEVTTYAVHPGVVRTELPRHITFLSYKPVQFLLSPLLWLTMKTPVQGAQTSLYCAVSEDLEGVTGRYYADCTEAPSSEASKNVEDAKKLWDVSNELVGL